MFNNWQAMNPFAAAAAQAQAQATSLYTQAQVQQSGQGQAGVSMGMDGNNIPQQQMYQWYYGHNWQQPPPPQQQQQLPQSGMMPQGYGQQQYPPLPSEQKLNPAPPIDPPLDVKPPLPPEPPPEDSGKDDKKKPQPPLPAQKPWQPPPPAEEPPSQPPPPQPPKKEVDPVLKGQMDELMQEERGFIAQYDQWKQQYHEWQEQNKNHPNKELFDQYLAQWKEYEQQMEERRIDIESRKKALHDSVKGTSLSVVTLQGSQSVAGHGGLQGVSPGTSGSQVSPGRPPGSNTTGQGTGKKMQDSKQFQGSREPAPDGVRQQGAGGTGPRQQYPSGGIDSEGSGQRQGPYRPVPSDSSSSKSPHQDSSPGGLRPSPKNNGSQQGLPPGKTAVPEPIDGGEDMDLDMDLDDGNQDDGNQNLQDFSGSNQFSGPQGFQNQGSNFKPGPQNYQGGPGPQNYQAGLRPQNYPGGQGPNYQTGSGPPNHHRGPGPQNFQGGPGHQNFHRGRGHFQGGRGGPQRFQGGGPQNFYSGQNFQESHFQGGPDFQGDSGRHSYEEEDQYGQESGLTGPDSWQDQHNAWQGGTFQDQRGGIRGRGMARSQRGRGGGPDNIGGHRQGMGQGEFGGHDMHVTQDDSCDMGYAGPDNWGGRGRGRGQGGFGGRGKMDMEVDQGEMKHGGHEGIGHEGFRGRGRGPHGFRGRGGPPFRGRGGYGGPGGNFAEDNYHDMRDDQNMDQDFHDQQHRMDIPPPFHGQGMRGGRGGPGMQGRGGPGQFQGRGGPAFRGRGGGPWQQGPNQDFYPEDRGQKDYNQDDWERDRGFEESDNFGGDDYGNQFTSRGRGGPRRSRGGPGFNTSRRGAMAGGPPDFSGPRDQMGGGQGLPGPGPLRSGGPQSLMAMRFNEKEMEQRLAENDPEETKMQKADDSSTQQENSSLGTLKKEPVVVPKVKPLSGKELGLGDTLPLSFGKGGGFEEEPAEEETEQQGWHFGQGRGMGRGRGRGRGHGGFHQDHEEGYEDVSAAADFTPEGRGGAFGDREQGRGGFRERGRGRGQAYGDGGEGKSGPFGETDTRGSYFESNWGRGEAYGEHGRGRGGPYSNRGRGRGGPFGGPQSEKLDDFEPEHDGPFGDRGRGRGGSYGPRGQRGGGRGQFHGEKDLETGTGRLPGSWGPDKMMDPHMADPMRHPPEAADPHGAPWPPNPEDWPPDSLDPLRDPKDPAYLDRLYRRPPLDPRAPVDPYDSYSRVRGPYERGYDPYLDRDLLTDEQRLRDDPYSDPYGRDRNTWNRDKPATAEPEKRLFVPAESIDYGHGPVAKSLAEETPKAKPEVIDYGHGSRTDDPIADLDREADRFERERASRRSRMDWDDSYRRAESSSRGQPEKDRPDDDTDRRDRGSRGESDSSRLPAAYRDNRGSGFSDDRSRHDDRSRFETRSRDDFDREGRSDRSHYSDWSDRRDDSARPYPMRERGGLDDKDSRSDREDRFTRDYGHSRDGHSDRHDRGSERPGYGDRLDRFDRPGETGYGERERGDRDWMERGKFDRDKPDTDRYEREKEGRELFERDRLTRSDRRDNLYDRDRDAYGRDRDREPPRRDRDTSGRDRDSLGRDRDGQGRDRERDVLGRERDFGRDRDVGRDDRDREPYGRDQDQFGRDRDPGRDRDRDIGKDRDSFGRPDISGRPDRGRPEFPERVGFPEREDRPLEFKSDRPDRTMGPSDFRQREVDRVRDAEHDGSRDRSPRDFTRPARDFHTPPTVPGSSEKAKVEDLICTPGRASRPPHLVVIVRGLPGSGKTYVSKLLREKEIANGGSAPRMLSLDDYFMVEVEKKEIDPDTGKKVTRKVLEYEYEQDMEEAYLQSLFKSFKKTLDDGFFPFIIVDAINEKVKSFEPFWSYAKSKGFQVYVAELEADVPTCINRNIHKWTEYDVEKVKGRWEATPPHFLRLDIRWLLQDASITEVEMEDAPEEEKIDDGTLENKRKREEDDEEDEDSGVYKKSKWELDTSEVKLDKLDGLAHGMHKREKQSSTSMEDYLQLSDDYYKRKSTPGKKMVRWADLEEKKEQNRRRELGFVVGQTQKDWDRITDDTFAEKALNQTKYI